MIVIKIKTNNDNLLLKKLNINLNWYHDMMLLNNEPFCFTEFDKYRY